MSFIEDLAELPHNVAEIAIRADVKNVARLKELKSLRKVSLYAAKQQQLEAIVPLLGNITDLKMYEVRCTDLSLLNSLTNLQTLDLTWNTIIETLWDMSNLTSPTSLSIEDFSKLSDITNISKHTSLKHLAINSGMWKTMKLNSITPLTSLINLGSLELGLAVQDSRSILPIATLKQLKELSIPANFPVEEIARLSVELPNTNCETFHPYIKVDIGNEMDMLVVGKRKPFLNSRTDGARIKKYVDEFRALQDKYRADN